VTFFDRLLESVGARNPLPCAPRRDSEWASHSSSSSGIDRAQNRPCVVAYGRHLPAARFDGTLVAWT
jgi:hypothetical protein